MLDKRRLLIELESDVQFREDEVKDEIRRVLAAGPPYLMPPGAVLTVLSEEEAGIVRKAPAAKKEQPDEGHLGDVCLLLLAFAMVVFGSFVGGFIGALTALGEAAR